jgi:hypothetical protein
MAVPSLVFPVDRNGVPLPVMSLGADSNNLLLAAATNEAITIPTGARFVRITASAEAWVRMTTTFGSTVPAIDASTGTAGIVLRAGAEYIFSVDAFPAGSMQFIAAATPLVNIVFF